MTTSPSPTDPDGLRACPWCNGSNILILGELTDCHFAECQSCGAASGDASKKTREEAVALWNKRPIEAALRAELQAAKGERDEYNKEIVECLEIVYATAELLRIDLMRLVEERDDLRTALATCEAELAEARRRTHSLQSFPPRRL